MFYIAIERSGTQRHLIYGMRIQAGTKHREVESKTATVRKGHEALVSSIPTPGGNA